jgi:hypothetical protein
VGWLLFLRDRRSPAATETDGDRWGLRTDAADRTGVASRMTARQPRPGREAGIAFGATEFMIRHRFGGYLRAVPSRLLVLPF